MVCVIALALEDPSPIRAGRDAVGYSEGDAEPYLSLAVFDDVHESVVSKAASSFASKTKAIRIGISGLGIFPNENPVIYASVLASDSLLSLHRSLYSHLTDTVASARQVYVPGNWMPHISLNIGERKSLASDVETLMEYPFRGEYNCLEVIVVTGPPPKVQERFQLT